MFVDEDHGHPTAGPLPDAVAARSLLRACSADARRLAQGLAQLDRSLGDLVARGRAAEDAEVASGSSPTNLPSRLLADLQAADHLRQQMEGLAGALDLLSRTRTLQDMVPIDALFACTPLAVLRSGWVAAVPNTEANTTFTEAPAEPPLRNAG